MINRYLTAIIALSFCSSVLQLEICHAEEKPLKVTVSKETTFITKPLKADGYPDYIEALNATLGAGATVENNIGAEVFRLVGCYEVHKDIRKPYFARMGMAVPPEYGSYLSIDHLLSPYGRRRERTPTGVEINAWTKVQEEYAIALDGVWNEQMCPSVAKWLKQMEGPLDEVIAMSNRTHFFMPYITVPDDEKDIPELISILLPGAQKMRELARGLAVRANYLIGTGDMDGAIAHSIALHRIGRISMRGGTLVEGLVGIAVDNIACGVDQAILLHGKPTTSQLESLATGLGKLPKGVSLGAKINQCERFMFLDTTITIAKKGPNALTVLDELTGSAATGNDGLENIVYGLAGSLIKWDDVLNRANSWYDRIYGVTQIEEPAARRAAFSAVDADLEKTIAKAKDPTGLAASLLFGGKSPSDIATEQIGTTLIALLLPAMNAAVSAEDQMHMRLRLSQVAIAVERYKRDNDAYPDKLEAIVPEYLPKIPRDDFGPRVVSYVKNADVVRVYSFGRNLNDDGGLSNEDNTETRADDLRVTLWQAKKLSR